MSEASRHDESTWRPGVKFVFLAFAVVGTFFLIAEHRTHVLPWLPWLFLAACPLMHVFMHHGHSGRQHHGNTGDSGGRSTKRVRSGDTTPARCGYTNGTGPPEPREGERS